MNDSVDILVANQNTLPWLKLLVAQYNRYKPKIASDLFIWDNGSSDGSQQWIASAGIRHHLHPANRAHFDGLIGAMKLSTAPYIAYMDVDAFPIEAGWLDEAINVIRNDRVGAAGLSKRLGDRREFIHPSFCVFRRELYNELSLSPSVVHAKDFSFDVCELMCATLQDRGYSLSFLGRAFLEINEDPKTYGNRVFHAGGSCWGLSHPSLSVDFIRSIVIPHRTWLLRFGLWEQFIANLKESAPYNPFCERYFKCP